MEGGYIAGGKGGGVHSRWEGWGGYIAGGKGGDVV